MRVSIVLPLLSLGLAATVPQEAALQLRDSANYGSGSGSTSTPLALTMLDSIIARNQGISVNPAVKTSVIEAGLLLQGLREVLDYLPLSADQKAKYENYQKLVSSGLIPGLSNVTVDAVSPLDEFSVGYEFIQQFQKTGNQTLVATIQALHQTDLIRKRQQDGSYWYYVYTNATTQDGLFSIPGFHSLYARQFAPSTAQSAYQTSLVQFTNIVDRCLSHSSGLLYHGYDPTRAFPIWGDLNPRGHSQSIWGRAVGWTVVGLLNTLDAIPVEASTLSIRKELQTIFAKLVSAIVHAQDTSGAWWQVLNFPNREKNFLESSATGLFAYSILRGLRLGLLGTGCEGDVLSSQAYRQSAEKAYGWLHQNALLHLSDGTVGYNLTVDVCSINSTTAFDFYVAQPLKANSLLGEVGLVLTDLEIHLEKK